MNEKEIALGFFRQYYENADLDIPEIEKREFGIGNIKKIDARHLSFANTAEFRSYLVSNTPMFVSHSTAYYQFPGATPIQKKVWTGADLVFDLDIHAEGKYGAYALLDAVKADAIRLVEEFLAADFGIAKKDITINFSGNRGYHIHVRDARYQEIGSDERKEIIDYIMGTGLNYRNFFEEEEVMARVARLRGPKPDEAGYRGRFARAVMGTLEREPKAISRIFAKEDARKNFTDGIKEGNWSRTSLKANDLLVRLEPIARSLPLVSVNTDAGVTQDLSKLIRVPNSIHGETGLIAKKIENIEKFDPLRDAFVESKESGSEAIMKIKFSEDVPELRIKGEIIGPFKKDEEKEMVKPVALFFVLKGSAAIIS